MRWPAFMRWVCFGVFAAAGIAWGQDDSAARPAEPQSATPAGAPGGASRTSGLPGETGPVALPVVERLPTDVPEFYISQLDISGQVVDDRAELSATVVLYVTQPDIWQTIPLRLPQATILSREYDGVGQAAPVVSEENGEGILWSFRGAGRHELKLDVQVPLVKTPGGQRLEMTLPRLPEQFRGRLTLDIPTVPIEVTSEDFDIRPLSVRNDRTRVEAFIPGGGSPAAGTRLALSWAAPSGRDPGTVESAQTESVLRRSEDGDRWVLTARQNLRSAEGGLSVVRVRLPAGFELDNVTGTRFAERIEAADGGRDDGWVTVRLDSSPSPTAELTWTLSAPVEFAEPRLELGGVVVDTARRQSGTVSVEDVPGHHVTVLWEDATNVRRVATARAGVVATAEFTRLPFVLPVAIEQDRPFLVAAPKAALACRGDSLELREVFEVGVEAGAVSQVELEWPDREVGGWTTVETLPEEGLVRCTLVTDGDRTVVRFAEPQSSPFRFGLLARQAVASRAAVRVGLPRMNATIERPTELLLLTADGVDVDLTVSDESALRPAPPREAKSTTGASDRPTETAVTRGLTGGNLREAGRHLVFGEPASLVVRQTARAAVTSTTSTLRVSVDSAGPSSGVRLLVGQSIDFSILYGRSRDVLLQLPEELTAGLTERTLNEVMRFHVDDESLPNSAVKLVSESLVRLTLPEPKSTFRVGVAAVPLAVRGDIESRAAGGTNESGSGEESGSSGREPGRDGLARFPLIRAIDADYELLRLEATSEPFLKIVPFLDETSYAADSGRQIAAWAQSTTAERGRTLWLLSNPIGVRSVPLRVRSDVSFAPSSYLVDSSRLTLRPTVAGTRVEGVYRISEATSDLGLVVPSASRNRQFTWNGETVSARPPAGRRDGRTRIELPLDSRSSGTLRIAYDLPQTYAGPFASHSVPLPALPLEVRSRSTEVVIELPDGRLLLESPNTLTPRFRWRRTGFWFSRVSPGTDNGASETASAASETVPVPGGSSYAYTAVLCPAVVNFQTGSVRGTLLGGALASLLAAALIATLPSRLRLIAILLLGLTLAGLSVWRLETLQVLIQPALLGVALALVAWWANRRATGQPRRHRVLRVPSSDLSHAVRVDASSGSGATVIRGNSSAVVE